MVKKTHVVLALMELTNELITMQGDLCQEEAYKYNRSTEEEPQVERKYSRRNEWWDQAWR